MKKTILSLLGSILLTIFMIGFFVFFTTGDITIMTYSGVIIMLIGFYLLIKYLLDD